MLRIRVPVYYVLLIGMVAMVLSGLAWRFAQAEASEYEIYLPFGSWYKNVGWASPGETVLVPAGEFQMGCVPGDPIHYCHRHSQPLHAVYLDAFNIYRHEVTNQEFVEYLNYLGTDFCGDGYCINLEDSRSQIYIRFGQFYVEQGYELHPVRAVAWRGADTYCRWVGARLPTEAEWEKAARGSADVRSFPWGNQPADCARANVDLASGEYCVGTTTPIGSYPAGASPYGAMDMIGNLMEWTNDYFDPDYYDVSPYANPQGPATGSAKVFRGGSYWSHFLLYQRGASAGGGGTTYGFRCVEDIAQ